jgi:hypothetical protein
VKFQKRLNTEEFSKKETFFGWQPIFQILHPFSLNRSSFFFFNKKAYAS